jgi:hypothetical protein
MHPLYLPDILSSTCNRSLWNAERVRLAALLLDEAEKVRQSPAESRNWDFTVDKNLVMKNDAALKLWMLWTCKIAS